MTWWKCCCDVSRSSETTQACKQGRSTTIRLRCNPTVTSKDLITLPRYLSLGPSSTFDLTRVVHGNISFDKLLYYNRAKMSHKQRVVPIEALCPGYSSVEVPSKHSQYLKIELSTQIDQRELEQPESSSGLRFVPLLGR